MQVSLHSRNVGLEPAHPAEGAPWILPDTRSGPVWSGLPPKSLAAWCDAAWLVVTSATGFHAGVEDEAATRVIDGSVWRAAAVPSTLQLTGLAIGAAPDGTNLLLARLNSALLSATGTAAGGTDDLRLALNKAMPAATSSLLWQTGYSGRAGLGRATTTPSC